MEWRKAWADVTNRYLERYGHDERIDHRSHADRGLTDQPTIHEGVVEPVLNACHVAVGAVGIDGVEVVVDGNIPHAVLRKRVVDIKPCQRGITTKPTEVFRNHHSHMTGFNFRKHLLKAGAVGKIHAAVPVINKERRVRKVLRFCILY